MIYRLALVFITILSPVPGQLSDKVQSLKGIPPFAVLVESLNEHAKTIGMTEQAIKTTVELRLRTLGVPVTSHASRDTPYLYVNVNAICETDKIVCVFNIDISFYQRVFLYADDVYPQRSQATVWAATWDAGGIVLRGIALFQAHPQIIQKYTDMFANDYLEANPKK
jgi:hypothetical protein